MSGKILFSALFFILIAGSFLFCQPVQVNIEVSDKLNHVVSDVFIIASYQEVSGTRLETRQVNGTTGNSGVFEFTLAPSENSTVSSHIVVQAYHPAWSSRSIRVRLPLASEQPIVTQRITLPIEFETYRLRVEGNDSTPVQGATVQLVYPFFLTKKTGANGIVQFRVPKGLAPFGWTEYDGTYSNFSFVQDGENVNYLNIVYAPEWNSLSNESSRYSFELQAFDSSNHVLPFQSFNILTEYSNSSYMTDEQGRLRIFDIPYENITLSWVLHNYTYFKNYNLTDFTHARLVSESLLKIHEPHVTHLGESCYRVEVNITDPREGALKQVVARSLDVGSTLAITLEQNQTINQTQLIFNRIFCVNEDTEFDILASNPYENTSLTLKLLRRVDMPPPQQVDFPQGVAFEEIPDFVRENAEAQRKTETIIILLEILFLLVIAYFAVRFNSKLLYYFQAIIRFVHSLIGPVFKKKGHSD